MKVMPAGHVDEIGVSIHLVDEHGPRCFSPARAHPSPTPVAQRVWIHGGQRLRGVVGPRAIHLLDADEP